VSVFDEKVTIHCHLGNRRISLNWVLGRGRMRVVQEARSNSVSLACIPAGQKAGSGTDCRPVAGIDLSHDEQTLSAGQKFECPVLALMGVQVFAARGYDLLGVR